MLAGFTLLLRRFGAFAAGAACLLWPSISATAAQDAPIVREASIQAHPALWTVHSPTATAYILGSIHLLPPNMLWRTPAINSALEASDVYVFEAPLDSAGMAAVTAFVREHGLLPPGETLPSLLDGRAQKDFHDAVALTDLPENRLDNMRPWLASIALETAYMEKQHYSPMSGVDRQVFDIATAHGKSIRCFETVDQQLSLLTPPDEKLEVQEFDVDIRQFKTEMSSLGPFVDAWASGKAERVGALLNKDLDEEPGARKALIDDRNKAWLTKLDGMMSEHHTYFITVGAGHLVGPRGVPALLKAKGFRVDSP
jgi:uncharacterized protein